MHTSREYCMWASQTSDTCGLRADMLVGSLYWESICEHAGSLNLYPGCYRIYIAVLHLTIARPHDGQCSCVGSKSWCASSPVMQARSLSRRCISPGRHSTPHAVRCTACKLLSESKGTNERDCDVIPDAMHLRFVPGLLSN